MRIGFHLNKSTSVAVFAHVCRKLSLCKRYMVHFFFHCTKMHIIWKSIVIIDFPREFRFLGFLETVFMHKVWQFIRFHFIFYILCNLHHTVLTNPLVSSSQNPWVWVCIWKNCIVSQIEWRAAKLNKKFWNFWMKKIN